MNIERDPLRKIHIACTQYVIHISTNQVCIEAQHKFSSTCFFDVPVIASFSFLVRHSLFFVSISFYLVLFFAIIHSLHSTSF